jgi:hypothetical protein
MPVMTPQQAQELSATLVEAFDSSTMAWVVRSALGPRLDQIVNVNQSFERIVPELLDWSDRRGPGTIEALLRGALTARPDYQNLRAFCERNFPGAMQPLDSKSLIQNVNLGLKLLIERKDDPAVRETVGGFRADFETTVRQIRILNKYKGLHDSLHELQLRIDPIVDALSRTRSDVRALRSLRIYALDLRQWAKNARRQTPDLPTKDVEEDWINDWDSCIQDMELLAKSTVKDADPGKGDEVADRLKALLSQSQRINGLLANAADVLKLDRFNKSMDTIAQKIRPFTAPDDPALHQLVASADAVGVLHSVLAGLVSEHYEWQIFEKQLTTAENSQKHQPQMRMLRWQQFKDRLTGLCDVNPQADWSHDLKDKMAEWIAATPSVEPSEVEKSAGEIAFAEFRRACVYRFYNVDKELNALSAQVTEVAIPLDTLLTAIH